MRLEGRIHCDGPECNSHQHVGVDSMDHGRLPAGWITVTEHGDFSDPASAFCGWDCLLKFAAKIEPPIEIPWDQALGGSDD